MLGAMFPAMLPTAVAAQDEVRLPHTRLDTTVVPRFARLALECVHREYPNKIAHVLQSDADVAPPRELTPAFAGCFDWHSAVHGHWLLARVARLYPGTGFADSARAALDANLTPEKIAVEVAYLRGDDRASFERPYGLAWLLQLAAELREWPAGSPGAEDARRWAAALHPLEVEAAERIRTWLPKLRYPIRTGEHSQTAFALGLIWDWAVTAGDAAMVRLIDERARFYHTGDRDCPLDYEPGGQDFLSPCLAEADLMRRVLDGQEFFRWLREFLPGIPRVEDVEPGRGGEWLPVAEVTDRKDGKLAHLDGLNLSRAWMLDGIYSALSDGDLRRGTILAALDAHAAAGLTAVTGEHYAGGHWLGSFATYLTTRRGVTTDPNLAIVRRFRAALAREDLVGARGLMVADARQWWEEKKGEGMSWRLGGGRWQDWDEEFRAASRIVAWESVRADQVGREDQVSYIVSEINDYYRLTGRGAQRYRRTYFMNPIEPGSGMLIPRIAGTMIQDIDDPEGAPSLFPEFEAWARENDPDEIAHLLDDEGNIDPTGDRAPRMRALLNRWREATGRPPIE